MMLQLVKMGNLQIFKRKIIVFYCTVSYIKSIGGFCEEGARSGRNKSVSADRKIMEN